MSTTRSIAVRGALGLAAVIAATGLAGCGGNSGYGAKSLPYGSSCSSIRSELRRLDNRGVPAKVEAVNAGRRVSAKDRELASRYNTLLNQYLGARCHT